MWRNRSLEHTRGHLVEFVSSEDVVISNVVLRNSPFWTLHPVYCKYVHYTYIS
jgi:polygalacturonase